MILLARNSPRRWSRWTLRANFVRIERLLHRGVAAADHGDLAVLEEEPVARRAGADTAAPQALFAFELQPDRRRAGRDDHALRAVLRAARPDAERAGRQVDALDIDVDELGAEALRLLPEAAHELRSVDAFREARVVLDLAGEHQLTTGRGARDDDGLEVGARGVDGGGEAGRARADDEHLRLGPMTCRGLPAVAVPEGFGSAGCIAADHRDGPAERIQAAVRAFRGGLRAVAAERVPAEVDLQAAERAGRLGRRLAVGPVIGHERIVTRCGYSPGVCRSPWISPRP